MTTNIRTCANCAFNPAPVDDEPTSCNRVSFTLQHAVATEPQALSRGPRPADVCGSHMTREEVELELDRAEVARRVADLSHEFRAAMDQLWDEWEFEHLEPIKVAQVAIEPAPDSLYPSVANREYEQGLIPNADGYTDNGEPVYSMESAAAFFGLTMEEAQSAVDAMVETLSPSELPALLTSSVTVHRKH